MIKSIQEREHRRLAKAAAEAAGAPAPMDRMERTVSRAQSIHESLYSNRTTFLKRTMNRFNLGKKVSVKPEEMKRISSAATRSAGEKLKRHPSNKKVTVPAEGVPVPKS